MIALTIGVGTAYGRMAELAAESVTKHTGLDVQIIRDCGDEPHPAKHKLRLLRDYPGEVVWYFDADVRMIAPWPDLDSYDAVTRTFRASRHDPSAAARRDCREYTLDLHRFFYSGLWFANLEHHGHAFHVAWQLCHRTDYRTSFAYEQTALNAAIQREGIPFEPIPPARHVVCDGRQEIPEDASMLHVAGRSLHCPNRKIFERAIFRRETGWTG